MVVFSRLMQNREIKQPKLQATFSLLAGISTDVASIRLVAENGFDVQAKNIVRSLREKIDALIAVQLDRSFAVQFVKADGSEEANRFWHRRVAKGKLIRNISKRLSHYSAEGETPIDKTWLDERKKLDLWLGEATHPSHTTGFLSAFPTSGIDGGKTDEVGLFGHPSELSVPTARTVLGFAYEVISLMRWRRLAPANDITFDPEAEESIITISDVYAASEKFLMKCIAESTVGPNLDMYKLQMYFDGYAWVPLEEEYDPKAYEAEIATTLLRVVQAMRDRLERIASDSAV